jgi:hypothetical protein
MLSQLFYRDKARYEWLLEKINLQSYELKQPYEYKRQTRYDKHMNEVKELTSRMREEKLKRVQLEFEKQKALFYHQKKQVLEEIQNDIVKLGFTDIQFPQLNEQK